VGWGTVVRSDPVPGAHAAPGSVVVVRAEAERE